MNTKFFSSNSFSKKVFLVVCDIISVMFSMAFALFIRFDFEYAEVTATFIENLWTYIPINLLFTIAVFIAFKLYSTLWTFAGINELQNLVLACALASLTQVLGMGILNLHMPRSYYFFYLFMFTVMVFCGRYMYRFIRNAHNRRNRPVDGMKNAMIIGAGEATDILIRENFSSEHLNINLKCAIDDDSDKLGSFIHGIKIVGTRDDILSAVERYEINLIIISMPSVSKKVVREIIDICKETECELKILPGVYQLVTGEVSVNKLRNVEIEDLLGRESIKIDLDSIKGYLKSKVVLVTGGGGSIGSELCRQIAAHNPKELIILDIYENNAYYIQQELLRKYPDLKLTVLIASVRDVARMENIFSVHRPDVVYHAAAHKHVPLMEDSPNEAVKNNVFGTLNTAKMADKYNAKKFVLISTDKAVNPTNVMGATKRMCEIIVQLFSKVSKTEFAAVRFGNVLGSNGSVIPVFKKQIELGGPVTVTHPDIIRYFMTIPEAVSLVLQTGSYAKGGEIFILDMGEPVKILDLATNLIKLSGYTPNEDIKIEFSGLRPGEKLYEELLLEEEGLTKTENNLIYIGNPIEVDSIKFWNQLDNIKELIDNETENIRDEICEIVTMHEMSV